MFTHTQYINALIANSANTDANLISELLQEKEQEICHMDVARRYYESDNDINYRNLYYYDETGTRKVDKYKVDNKISHDYFKDIVDQKAHFAFAKEVKVTVNNDDKKIKLLIDKLTGDKWEKLPSKLAKEASKTGSSFLHIFLDKNGNFKYKDIKNHEGIAIYDSDENLESFIYFYKIENKEKIETYYVEMYDDQFVSHFEMTDNKVTAVTKGYIDNDMRFKYELSADDVDFEATHKVPHMLVGGKAYGWGRVPFIEFYNNEDRKSDFSKAVKSKIDAIDILTTDLANTTIEIQNLMLVIKGVDVAHRTTIDGDDSISEAARIANNIKLYKYVGVPENGDIKTLEADAPYESTHAQTKRLKEDLYAQAGAIDKSSENFGNAPSGDALEFMYQGLQSRAEDMWSNFKVGFRELAWFMSKYLDLKYKLKLDYLDIDFKVDYSMITNKKDIVDMIEKSPYLSRATRIASNPLVDNYQLEMERLDSEESEGVGLISKTFDDTDEDEDDIDNIEDDNSEN